MLTVPHITVTGWKMNSMDLGKSHGQMALSTSASMTRDASMAVGSWCFLKEATTMASLKKTRYVDMVNTTGLMARTLLGLGLRTKWMDKANSYGLINEGMRATSYRTRDKVTAQCFDKMGANIWATGS